MKNFYFTVLIVLSIILSSCVSQKDISYFNGLNASSADSINKYFKTNHEPVICNGDMLSINVNGLDPLTVAPFNLPLIAYSNPGSDQIYSTPSVQSYLVDNKGRIEFPVVGTIKLGGLTKSEAIKEIKTQLTPYLKDPIVTIKFLNYKVSVLGEVARPGQYTINNERATILDALALAGDMTMYGVRKNVLVVRENDGKLEFTRLDMTSKDVFTSPYYFLQQNDYIYVEPNKVKSISSQNISLYLSTVSTLSSLSTAVMYLFITLSK